MDAELDKARIAYESVRGRCSDNHWYRTKRLMQRQDLQITPQNARFFAELRTIIPRAALGVANLFSAYRKVEILLVSDSTLTGDGLLKLLHQQGITPHQSTVSRWFSSLGGYSATRQYTSPELRQVLIRAFIYKAKHSQKLEGSDKPVTPGN